MPKLVNKSARIFHLDDGMLAPGGEVEVSPETLEKTFIQALMETGELMEAAEAQKAARTVQAAQQKLDAAKAELGQNKQQTASSVQGTTVKG